MPSCYDRTSCSVNPDNGALTINTKHGSCTVVPGDFVNISQQGDCFNITVTGQGQTPDVQTFNFCPGDQVDFTEDEGCYIITINNVPHCIPKCTYYRDCEGNILDACERIVTCDDLAQRGFISCVDPDDFNLTTECADGECVNCIAIKWDQICAEAETLPAADRPDNAQFIYCTNGEIKKSNFNDSVVDVIDNYCFNPDNTSETCGDLSYAVWQQCPEGGYKLASFSTNDAVSFSLFPRNVPWLPNDQNLIWPISPEFQNGDGPYSLAQLRADDDFGAGTVDETRMRNNIVAEATIDLACPTSFDFDTVASVNTASVPDVAAAYSMRVHLIHRWSVDGGPWNYRRIPNDNRISGTIPDNAVQQSVSGSQSIGRLRLPAGNVRIQLLLLTGEVLDAVPINVNTTEPDTGTANINQRFTQAVG